jgi:hypothetical protein
VSTKHTTTPWRVYDYGAGAGAGPYIVGVFVDPKGDCGPLRGYTITSHQPRPGVGTYWPASGIGGRSDDECRANAHRAVTCVNACDGFSLVDGDWVRTHEPMEDPAAEIKGLRDAVKVLGASLRTWKQLGDDAEESAWPVAWRINHEAIDDAYKDVLANPIAAAAVSGVVAQEVKP